MNRLIARLVLTILLLTALNSIHAATSGTKPANGTNTAANWYDIELVVFRYTDPQAGDLESWPADPGTPDWKNASPLIQPVTGTGTSSDTLTPFTQIQGHQLDGDWNRLNRSHDYQPLLHVTWTEPLTDHTTAHSVQIGVPPPAPAPATESVPGLALPPAPAATGSAPPPTPAPVPTPVYGTVKFSQYGPYLHFGVDLVCQGPIAKNVIRIPDSGTNSGPDTATTMMNAPDMSTQMSAAPQIQWYRMTQDRRIETGKVNYFDNPMFGVLVLVTPHPATTTH